MIDKSISKTLIFLPVMLLLFCSCQKMEQLFSRSYGSEVVFGPSTQRGANTRASYSGVTDKQKYERIDWNAGDYIRIYCAQASEPSSHYTDYFVKSDGITSSGSSSSATIDHAEDIIGLRWGNESSQHIFTALHPAPGHGVSGTSVAAGKVTCVLPAVQTYSGAVTVSKGHHVAAPNPSYIYLAGYGTADPKATGTPVNLYFDPAITAFQFTLQNAYESGADMTVKSAGITTASGSIVGQYGVTVTGINGTTGTLTKANIDTTKASGSTITMNFSSVQTIAKNDSLTFTLFAHPGKDITRLTFWFVDNSNVRRSFGFKYADSSKGTAGWVNFTAFHKIKIRGLMAPEEAGWTINMIPVVADWSENTEDIEVDYGNILSLSTPAVQTWGTGVNDNLDYTD